MVRTLLGLGLYCVHCVEPLNIKRQSVKDVQIRSVGYDRNRSEYARLPQCSML